jgi:hypothetical protein
MHALPRGLISVGLLAPLAGASAKDMPLFPFGLADSRCRAAHATTPLKPAVASLTPEQWRQDLQYLAEELPRRHMNLFYRLPKAEFERQVRELSASIPRLSEIEIRAALVRLVASVGNAHTSIDGFRNTPDFPMRFEAFPEGVYVTAAPAGHPEALGSRLLAVNGKPFEEVWRRLLPYVAKENELSPLVVVPDLLRTAAALQAAGIIGEMEQAEFALERDGARLAVALRSAESVQLTWLRPGMTAPLYRSRLGTDYWFEYLPDAKTMYVQYNSCRNMVRQSFKDFTAEVMQAAGAHPVEKFVIDLRFNGGGNSSVIQPLIGALKSRPRMRVYAIVGRHTFSSAFLGAEDLRKRCHAVLVGEAMGQRPNSYGNVRPLTLPNSGLTAYYCTKHFRLVKGDPPAIQPKVPVATAAAEYFSGRDPAMEYVLSR